MTLVHTIIMLLAAFLVVFLEASFNGVRAWLGAQVDLLPGLMIYAALSGGLTEVALLAVTGGLIYDSLSANPLAISVLPLLAIGLFIQRYRHLILREELFAQVTLGLAASAGAPVLTLLLLLNTEAQPLLSWFSIWQWIVVAVAGAAATPLWFVLLDRVHHALSYRPWGDSAFRPDREIKRGRQ
jgi:hypothetical protein